jgi:hypothetical protein
MKSKKDAFDDTISATKAAVAEALFRRRLGVATLYRYA